MLFNSQVSLKAFIEQRERQRAAATPTQESPASTAAAAVPEQPKRRLPTPARIEGGKSKCYW
jgi:hypothetical protein